MNLIVFNIVFFIGMAMLFTNFVLFAAARNKTHINKVLTAYLFFALTENLSCYAIFHLMPGSNYFVSHLYFLVHFTFLTWFFYLNINNTKMKRAMKPAYFTVYAVLILLFIINPKSFFGFHLFETISCCLLIIFYAFFNIFQTLDGEKRYYYFSIGVILNFSLSCLIYISGSLETVTIFVEDPRVDHWIFKDLFFVVYQIFIFREYIFLKKRNELSK